MAVSPTFRQVTEAYVDVAARDTRAAVKRYMVKGGLAMTEEVNGERFGWHVMQSLQYRELRTHKNMTLRIHGTRSTRSYLEAIYADQLLGMKTGLPLPRAMLLS